jgi:predicted transcriptional regulator
MQFVSSRLRRLSESSHAIHSLYPTGRELIGKKELARGLGIEESSLYKVLDNKPEGYSYGDAQKLLKFIRKMEKNSDVVGGKFY